MKYYVYIMVIALVNLYGLILSAQIGKKDSTETAKGKFDKSIKEQERKFQQDITERQRKFRQVMEEIDNKFIESLKNSWKEMEMILSLGAYNIPKPVKLPVIKDFKMPKKEIIRRADAGLHKPTVIDEKARKEEVIVKDYEVFSNLFGTPIKILFPGKPEFGSKNKIDNNNICDFWKQYSTINYEETISQLMGIKNGMRLNDWGYYLLLKKFVDGLYLSSNVEKNLIIWFFLVKSGYNAKVGYTDNELYLLLPFIQSLFGVPLIAVNNVTYYNVSLIDNPASIGFLKTYMEDYPNANKSFDLRIRENPNFNKRNDEVRLSFSYDGNEHIVSTIVNENLIEYYASYPNSDMQLYFTAVVSPESADNLKKQLGAVVAAKSEKESANILLRFVQTAFDYKVDNEQFGKEKIMFVEETLYYPFSDCEDRSILFAYLVKNLLGLPVVGLRYDCHIATAVKFSNEIEGDSINYDDKKYTICDPTFLYAGVGKTMPEMKGKIPKIIEIE